MIVYIAMKVPCADEELRLAGDLLSTTIQSTGHQPFLATTEITQRELIDPKEFMPFVLQNLNNADLLILLYHPDLRGGLIEAGMAYAQNIPIWLCHKSDEYVSSSMRGCAEVTIEYESLEDLGKKLFVQIREILPKDLFCGDNLSSEEFKGNVHA